MSEFIAVLAVKVYALLLPFSWLALAVAIFVLLPMSLIRRTRPAAGFGLAMSSWLFGLTTWVLGAAVTFATYGWLGLLAGFFFFGVGVIPIGIFAAFFSLKSSSLGISMIVMVLVTFGARAAGVAFMESESANTGGVIESTT